MKRAEELEMRRRLLVLRSERLRGELVQEGFRVQQTLSGIDRGVALVRHFLSRPAVLAAGAAGMLLLRRPVKAAVWGTRLAVYVTLARRVLGLLQALGIRPRISRR